MFTLRQINEETQEVVNHYLGNDYITKSVNEEERKEKNYGNDVILAISNFSGNTHLIALNDFACIMSSNGETFEVLNRSD